MLPFTEQRYASALNGILKMFFWDRTFCAVWSECICRLYVFLD